MFIYYYNTIFRRYTYSILSMPTRLNLWTLPISINNESDRSTFKFNLLDGYFWLFNGKNVTYQIQKKASQLQC